MVIYPVYDVFVEFVDGFKKDAPSPLHSCFPHAGRVFTWMNTQKALIDNMFMGFAVCFPCAFVVLLFATNNVFTSLYAVVSIAAIVASVLGMCKLGFDWDLGIAQSISGIIVIGLSVDYTVHLGHMYCESTRASREERVVHCLTYMGVTVVAGGVTTLGSGCFMYGCQITFFTTMAALI